jgi:hypothetical protein
MRAKATARPAEPGFNIAAGFGYEIFLPKDW